MILLDEEARLVIRSEGERAYPNECCGFLIGRFGEAGARVVTEARPVRNSREKEERYHRFVIEAEEFMRAEAYARKMGLELLGFYHSHPDHPAEPSGYDEENALPFYSYVIVAVEGGAAKNLTSWELSADRAGFVNEPIGAIPAAFWNANIINIDKEDI
ncbi:MAG: M67 family metallopeptidase [Synergistaceae bacterium]|jgi:proteasome lid subunit RPN8/RPN11|nr:M67 family metallopeptidase [Synergistaceae bacterium]